MKIPKAIEILEFFTSLMPKSFFPDLQSAMKLGIEALKMINEGRYKPGGMFFHDLPGETREEDPIPRRLDATRQSPY